MVFARIVADPSPRRLPKGGATSRARRARLKPARQSGNCIPNAASSRAAVQHRIRRPARARRIVGGRDRHDARDARDQAALAAPPRRSRARTRTSCTAPPRDQMIGADRSCASRPRPHRSQLRAALRGRVGDQPRRRRRADLVVDDAQLVALARRGAASCAGNCGRARHRPTRCAGSGAARRSRAARFRRRACCGRRRRAARSRRPRDTAASPCRRTRNRSSNARRARRSARPRRRSRRPRDD